MGVSSTPAARVDPIRAGTGLIFALGGLSAFGPLCLDMYLPALPDLPVSLHSTAALAQLTLSASILGLGAGQLLVGPVSDRWGRRVPLLAGLAVFVLTSVACALSPTISVLLVARLLQGAAGAAGIVISRAVVADRFTGTVAASYFSTIAAINGVAPILAPVIGAQILRVGDWRSVFWMLAGIGVALLLLAVRLVPESLPAARRTAAGGTRLLAGFGVVLRDRIFLGWVLGGTCVSAAMFGYISASPFLLQDGFGLTQTQFSFCFAGNAVGIVAISQLGRLLVGRGVRPVTLLTWSGWQCLAGAGLLTVALLARWPLPFVLAGLFVMVSAVGFALPFSAALAMDRHRQVAGAASALIGALQYAIGAVTAPLVGLGDRRLGVALAVTAISVAAVGVLAVARTRRAAGVTRRGVGVNRRP